MVRKNSLPAQDDELHELMARYEAMRAEKKQLYMDGDQLADIADYYAMEQRFEEAQEVINYGLQLHPESADLLIEQAYLYLDTDRLHAAIETADGISDSYSTEFKLLKAEILLHQAEWEAADLLIDTIEEREELDTVVKISYLYLDMGLPDKALPWLKQGLANHGEEEDLLAITADCYFVKGLFKEAEDYYNKLIDAYPFYAPYWISLSKSYFAEQDFSKALESIDFALAIDEHAGEAHLMRAHCLFHLDNNTEAIAAYEKTLYYKTLSPELIYMFIGLVYSNEENWEEAEVYFGRSLAEMDENRVKNEPLLLDLYCNQARCLYRKGDCEKAHAVCEKAKACSSDDCEPYLIDGRIYLSEGALEEASAQWRAAIRCAPDADTWYQIATYYLESNRVEEARTYFEEALRLNPELEGINEQLASVCLILKDHKGFYKYNRQSEKPIQVESLYKELSDNCSPELADDLWRFLQALQQEERDNEVPN